MTKPLTQIGNEVREMTDAEYAQWQADAQPHGTGRSRRSSSPR
jgi:hypothetical protein